VHAITAEPGLLLAATEDRLHQAYREPAMPQTLALIARLRSAGLAAVVSGAGPSILVLGGQELTEAAVSAAISADEGDQEVAVGWVVQGWTMRAIDLDRGGAQIGQG
jgi:homoserine kinase